MAKFQAETGATADEAKAALEAMDRLAATNLQSFGTVADVLTQVRTQMGLTGAEAEAMANRILKWSTATGQDAVEATKAFDDVLDAWNLTAADSQSIMDALLVSHQKYGGSVVHPLRRHDVRCAGVQR
jgi:phage-related minor tail protein